MEFIICLLLGYLAGTVNPAYLLGRHNGVDIRQKGSGNAGASNAIILFGKARGFICAVLDIAKAYLSVCITKSLFPHYSLAFAVTASACILGHIFPFYLRFKGGKGLACLGGSILAFDWWVFIAMLATEILIVLVTNYLCFVPITASFLFPTIYGFMTKDTIGVVILLIPAFVILYRHVENLKRISEGTEMHFSYLWNPEEEMDRIQENIDGTEEAIEDRFCVK